MKAKEIMEKYNICRVTLYRWLKNGRISYDILPSGRYDYKDHIDKYYEQNFRKNIIYSRISSTTQKDNLPRQIERIKQYSSSIGIIIDDVYSEVASALNYDRKQYRKLYNEIIENKINSILIEYKDRLLRIGFEDFEELCKIHNTNIIVIDNSNNDISEQEEIRNDLISIIHHFSSKIYSRRRIKKITDAIRNDVETL